MMKNMLKELAAVFVVAAAVLSFSNCGQHVEAMGGTTGIYAHSAQMERQQNGQRTLAADTDANTHATSSAQSGS